MPPLALTMGDPAGIGGELTLKAWLALRGQSIPFVAVDDADRLGAIARDLRLDVPVTPITSLDAVAAVFPKALPVLPVKLAEQPRAGQASQANAKAVVESIERAASLALRGAAGGIVTNPINKAALYEAGFRYPGHTEFLAALTGAHGKQIMMLASPHLRVVPVTVHDSLRNCLTKLNADMIAAAGRTTAVALRDQFGIAAPRLAIAGLNPHAGEHGALGDEESTIIEPAIAMLRAEGIDVSGPWPSDTMFTIKARMKYDVAICMYHDQALIPLKTLDMDHGVNVTLGLPIVRTSPDHGTAYDIAGQGIAEPSSLIAASPIAATLAHRRGGTENAARQG
jgi:4-hydroxythreonine-4-phosphate dehydrogenase